MRAARILVVATVIACGPIAAEDADDTSGGSSAPSPSPTTVTSTSAGPMSTSAGSSATTASDSTSSGVNNTTTTDDGAVGDAFIEDPDGGHLGGSDCDVWVNNCPRGDKCMPWANDGGGSWNSTRCSGIAETPNAVGEPCTVEGSGVSGVDDCEAHSMCWDIDFETNTGTCVGFCNGSEANPSCPDPCDGCVITNDGVLILCLPTCDPLVQDCDSGEVCLNIGDTFACGPAGQANPYPGEPCEFSQQCDPGVTCIAPERVPGCLGEVGCCASFCNVMAPEDCANDPEGSACIPWFDEGESPPCISQGIGVCALPG